MVLIHKKENFPLIKCSYRNHRNNSVWPCLKHVPNTEPIPVTMGYMILAGKAWPLIALSGLN